MNVFWLGCWLTASYALIRLVSRLHALLQNVREAQRLPFPYVVVPWPEYPILWRLIGSYIVPFCGTWGRFIRPGLFWHEKGQLFDLLKSDVFLVVSPNDMRLLSRDDKVAEEVTTKRMDWNKPVRGYKFFEVFGPNLITTEGNTWHRQKKVIAVAFAERNNRLVWGETWKQVTPMLQSWLQESHGGVISTHNDLEDVARNVISYAGFGQQVSWSKQDDNTPKTTMNKSSKYSMTTVEAINTIMLQILQLYIIPRSIFPYLPGRFATLYRAWKEFPLRMADLVNLRRQQMESTDTKDGGTGQLLDEMIIAADKASAESLSTIEKGSDNFPGKSLETEELIGNVFAFYIAGSESTSAVAEFVISCLAIYPEYQRSFQEKLDEHKASLGGKSVRDWTYEESRSFCYPLAYMYEALRLWPIAQGLPKRVASGEACIPYKGRNVPIPTGYRIAIDVVAIHRHPKIWGSDCTKFNPNRWLTDDVKLAKMPKGVFLGFAEGARACIGRKFAETEFKGIVCTLFENNSVELYLREKEGDTGKSLKEVREDAIKSMNDLKYRLAFSQKRSIPVRWIPR